MVRHLIFNHPEEVTAEQLELLLPSLPEWRRQQAMSFRFLLGRVLCCEAYLLLKRGLREEFGLDMNPTFDYIGNGKPVFREHPEIYFSLSHCRRGVLCAFGDEPVGCDIESIQEKVNDGVCHRCLNDAEIAEVNESDNPCIEFTRLWTMKESALKLTGEGINDEMPMLFDGENRSRFDIETNVCASERYVYSICRYGNGEFLLNLH